MDDIEELLTDTHALVKDTVARALAEGLPSDQIGDAIAAAFEGKAVVTPSPSRPRQASPESAGVDIPALLAAAKAAPVTFQMFDGKMLETRTVIDRDAVTGKVVGHHFEPLG